MEIPEQAGEPSLDRTVNEGPGVGDPHPVLQALDLEILAYLLTSMDLGSEFWVILY